MCCCVWDVWCTFFSLLSFFYCLNINPLKSCTKAVVSNLMKQCIHPSHFNKAVSCCCCEAVDCGPLCSRDLPWHSTIFEVMMITSCLPLSYCPLLSTNRLRFGITASKLTPVHYVIVCFSVWKGCVRVIVEKTDKFRLHLKAVRSTLMLTVA